MAVNLMGTRATAAAIITGPGVLYGLLVSHAQTTPQTLTFYDNTAASGTILLTIHIAPERSPALVKWARVDAIPFSTGLAYTAPNCELAVWAVQH